MPLRSRFRTGRVHPTSSVRAMQIHASSTRRRTGSGTDSLGGEAVEQPVPARANQVLLAAASASVGGIPRSGMLASTVAVVMAHPGAALAVACPVAAGRVLVPRESGAVERRCCTARSKLLTSPVPVAESPGAVRIGHPERGHLVEYLAPNSVFNSLPRQRSSPHLRPDDRLVTIDRVFHHASLGAA